MLVPFFYGNSELYAEKCLRTQVSPNPTTIPMRLENALSEEHYKQPTNGLVF